MLSERTLCSETQVCGLNLAAVANRLHICFNSKTTTTDYFDVADSEDPFANVSYAICIVST